MIARSKAGLSANCLIREIKQIDLTESQLEMCNLKFEICHSKRSED
jgi:hypothetical protein